ncbi:hypothetical protein BDV30DRAFT_229970 [Aspergillus minisclerotigenes]|uniref:Major facilitator superfamily domain-containing protein n=1 Tax=Aspergillus minisclerotigenes TaxID=656917 RepID=A0A5N6IT55_9EURO|nr:hypothetical protein BDV30DRAFT_229970 [Aspergillus minisclerotigenes]
MSKSLMSASICYTSPSMLLGLTPQDITFVRQERPTASNTYFIVLLSLPLWFLASSMQRSGNSGSEDSNDLSWHNALCRGREACHVDDPFKIRLLRKSLGYFVHVLITLELSRLSSSTHVASTAVNVSQLKLGRLENIHVLKATSTNRTTILKKQHQHTMSTATYKKRTWYRTTFFNISVVSLCAFIAPGLWAAMNGLGGAGAADPHYVNAANSVIFCLQVLASQSTRLVYIAISWSRIVGQMIGGSVTLGVNAGNREKGHISVKTYFIFISIQALGPFVAALLSSPDKVQRSDRSPVSLDLPRSLKAELNIMWKLLCWKEILLLLPMIFQSVFSEAFFSTYNATYFTVRSRALASLVASTCVTIANFMLGFFLDWKRPTVNTRAIVAFVLIYAFELSLYIYAIVVTKEYERRDTPPVLDWADDGFGRGVCVYILMLVGFNLMYDCLYWLIGTVNRSGGDIVRLSAVVRGVESAGQAISYGINSIDQTRFPLSGSVAVNLAFFAACIIPSAFVVCKVGILNGVKAYRIQQDEDVHVAGGRVEGRGSDSSSHDIQMHIWPTPSGALTCRSHNMQPLTLRIQSSSADHLMLLCVCGVVDPKPPSRLTGALPTESQVETLKTRESHHLA